MSTDLRPGVATNQMVATGDPDRLYQDEEGLRSQRETVRANLRTPPSFATHMHAAKVRYDRDEALAKIAELQAEVERLRAALAAPVAFLAEEARCKHIERECISREKADPRKPLWHREALSNDEHDAAVVERYLAGRIRDLTKAGAR